MNAYEVSFENTKILHRAAKLTYLFFELTVLFLEICDLRLQGLELFLALDSESESANSVLKKSI